MVGNANLKKAHECLGNESGVELSCHNTQTAVAGLAVGENADLALSPQNDHLEIILRRRL